MSAMPAFSQHHTSRPVSPDPAPAGSIAAGWALLHEAANAVAELAQLGPERELMAPEAFEARALSAGTTRLALASRAIDDCAATMHYGLEALISVRRRGEDGTAAALTLWREFHRAREALLTITATAH